jgi:hypothetical protein
MLVAFCLPAGTAFAAAEYVKISGSYKYVEADAEGEPAGTIDVVYGDDYDGTDIDVIYAEITLPDGVEFSSVSTVAYSDTDWELVGSSDTSLIVKTENMTAADFPRLTISEITLDIDSDVTGNINADVRVWAVNSSGAIAWDVSDNVTIAKVASGDVTVTAGSPKILSVGSGKEGAKITIKELSPGALGAGSDIFLTIKSSGVKWDKSVLNGKTPATVGVKVYGIDESSFTSDKTLHLIVKEATTVLNGKIEFTPVFLVQPGASGDVVVKVSGDDVPTTELTVGTLGEGDVAVTVDKEDKDSVYIGQTATFDNVKVTLDPSTQLNDGEYITITLPVGLKWVDPDDADPVEINTTSVKYVDLLNSDRTVWLNVYEDESGDVELTNFQILADYNATPGDLEITFDGAVEGTYKIGAVKNAFTITAEAVNLPQRGSDVAAGKIVITEDADGALFATDQDNDADNDVPDYLDIVLPMGMTWARTPDIDVVDGDIDVSIEGIDGDTLKIEINNTSNLASTIELTDVYFNIDNRAALGDAVAKVGKEYNKNSSNYLASVKVGTIVSPTAGTATMKIGDPTIVINGETKVMEAAPYIKNSRTYVSVTYAALACGVAPENIMWDGVNRTVTVIKGDRIAQFKIGSNVMTLNGAVITMDTAPEIVNARTMMPVTWVALALGGNTAWDAENQIVTVTVN